MTPQQQIKEVLQDYDVPYTEKDWKESRTSDVQMGLDIKEMMETRGWKEWFYPMADELLKRLNTIEDVTTIRELEAKKKTYSAIKLLFDSLDGLIDKANASTVELNQYNDSTQE